PAAGIVLAHNHPSGDVRPSPEDVDVTRQLAGAVRLFGLELVDHLVVSRTGYCSLKELGEM
ncbi:MAG TPA: JAB domain-containing protein, partial [Candidatus Dormibacteraeota bacterium]|nr:JAB domain-containing protein [Candidatus Dormibacteraeota bacterium]